MTRVRRNLWPPWLAWPWGPRRWALGLEVGGPGVVACLGSPLPQGSSPHLHWVLGKAASLLPHGSDSH